MPRRNDFLEGLLRGMYQGGIGNPSVNPDANRDPNAPGAGTVGKDHPVWNAVRSAIFPGARMAAASPYYQQPTGEIGMVPPKGTRPPGSVGIPADKGIPQLASQYKGKSSSTNVTWATADAADKKLGEGLYNGTLQTQALSWKDRGRGTKLAIEYALENNLPPYVSYAGDVKAGAARLYSSGKAAQTATSIDTALKHLGTLSNKYDDLGNLDERFLNIPLNKLKSYTDNPDVVAVEASLTAVQNELATAFKGTGATDQEIKEWRKSLSPDLTPRQQMGMLQTVDELLRGRLDALEYQRKNVMGSPISERELLSPSSRKVSKKIRNPLLPQKGTGAVDLGNGFSYTVK